MTLLQSLRSINTTIIYGALVSVLFLHPGVAQEKAEDDHLTLFSCGTDEVDDRGFLDLQGVEVDYKTWVDLRFRRTADETGDLVYSFPPPGTDYRTAFMFSHSDGGEGYLVSIRWTDSGRNYVYYSLDIPPDPAEESAGGGEAGLVVSRDGKELERYRCIEKPYMFVDYMRTAMSCDVDNPYGPVACEESSFERTTPLDVSTIGIVR